MLNKKKLGALLLSGVMTLSISTSVFAIPQVGTGGSEENPITEVPITKNLELAEGLTIPNAEFRFKVEPLDGAPAASIEPISYNSKQDSLGDLTDEKYYRVSKDSAIVFGQFPNAGIFEYKVTEVPDTYKADINKDEVIRYSTDSYLLRVYVKIKKAGGTYISDVTAEKNVTSQEGENKVGKIDFTNVYTKRGEGDIYPDPHSKSLKIQKITEGAMADKTEDFDFTIQIVKSPTDESEGEPSYTGHIYVNDRYTDEAITVKNGSTFQLHDGESLVLNDIPAGTRYIVTEKGKKDGYVPSVQVTENGVRGNVITGTDEADLDSAEAGKTNLVGEKENTVVFTNIRNDVAVTGVFMNNLPFVLLIFIGAAAFGILAIAKRHKVSRR